MINYAEGNQAGVSGLWLAKRWPGPAARAIYSFKMQAGQAFHKNFFKEPFFSVPATSTWGLPVGNRQEKFSDFVFLVHLIFNLSTFA